MSKQLLEKDFVNLFQILNRMVMLPLLKLQYNNQKNALFDEHYFKILLVLLCGFCIFAKNKIEQ